LVHRRASRRPRSLRARPDRRVGPKSTRAKPRHLVEGRSWLPVLLSALSRSSAANTVRPQKEETYDANIAALHGGHYVGAGRRPGGRAIPVRHSEGQRRGSDADPGGVAAPAARWRRRFEGGSSAGRRVVARRGPAWDLQAAGDAGAR